MNQDSAVVTEVRPQMREFIEENFLYMHPGVELHDDDRLLETGVMDSLGFIELVEEVQSRYGVRVPAADITEENFGSVSAIARYVEGRRT
jgi:acyl carrier protein